MINGYEVSRGIGIGIAYVPEESTLFEAEEGNSRAFLSGLKPGSVLVAGNLSPAVMSLLRDSSLAGIVCVTGGMTSHSALIARSFGIPAVYGAGMATELIHHGDTVIVDGTLGYVYERPEPALVSEFSERRKHFLKDRAELERFRSLKTVMADGSSAEISCNVNDIFGVMNAIDNGAEGIGLLRTENLFSDMKSAPGEEEQFRSYMRVAKAMDGHPVIIRTLDIGGDKMLPYMNMEQECNPFLGYRAIRYSLGNREFFATQLRALLRAASYGNVSILLPMVTCIEEIREVKSLIHEIKTDLRDEGATFDDDIRIGAMIETPAAAMIADMLAGECDFFSIGTNDLVQYTMCADRGNSRLAYLQSVMQPPVLRLISGTIESAKHAGIPVSVCGEAAADPLMIPVLAGMGCRNFSVDPFFVPEVRRTLSEWTAEDAENLARDVLKMTSGAEIKEYLKKQKAGS
ncbi:MAG: phosphoenolpyruvate--protein phosphotransferase [Lachnospiraceae bacterium]|nr:phosphoenolpyruvate--protein phosphotransferase [Lachnospiraceae bacterium]